MGRSPTRILAEELAGLQSRVLAHLRAADGHDGASEVTIRPLGGGACQENLAVRVAYEDGEPRRYVLRSDAPSSLMGSIARRMEAPVISAAVAAGVTTPQALFVVEDLVRKGASAYFMPWVAGVAIGRKVVGDPTLADARRSLTPKLAGELARIHSVTPGAKAHLFDGHLPPTDPATDALNTLDLYLQELPTPRPALLWVASWLRRHPPSAEGHVLVHGDFRTGNFMVTPAGLQGILDWEFARWGSRAEDLAWICVRDWRFGVLNRPVGGFGQRSPFLHAYEAAAEVDMDPERLHWWEVMGNARWAVGALQQSVRYLSGKATDLEFLAIGRRAVEMEWEAMRLIRSGVPTWRAR